VNAPVKPGITELSDGALARLLEAQPAFRRVQIRHAVYHGVAQTFADISTLPRALRTDLAARLRFSTLIERRTEVSQDGTRKILFHTADGAALEAVQMPGERGPDTTACISSQAGCAMGCTFCATGAVGLTRSLTAAEIVDQFLHLRRSSDPRHTPHRVVFMGMGEPLANLQHVHGAIEALVDPDRVGLGARRVTVSTVGLPVGIEAMAGWGWPLGLAISLHAPLDDLRAELVPPARRISIASLMAASLVYQERTGRRAEGSFYSGNWFVQKCATGGGILVGGQVIALSNLPAGAAPEAVSQDVITQMILLYCGAITVLGCIAAYWLGRFPIDRAQHEARVAALDATARADVDAAVTPP